VGKLDGKGAFIAGPTRGQAVHRRRPGGGVTDILNADDLYHTGIVVSDLDAAMAKLTRGIRPPVDHTTVAHSAGRDRSWPAGRRI